MLEVKELAVSHRTALNGFFVDLGWSPEIFPTP
jgi:hypothetical protein